MNHLLEAATVVVSLVLLFICVVLVTRTPPAKGKRRGSSASLSRSSSYDGTQAAIDATVIASLSAIDISHH